MGDGIAKGLYLDAARVWKDSPPIPQLHVLCATRTP